MIATKAALLRAVGRLTARLEALEGQLDRGDDVWPTYCETAAALATVASLTTPEARGALLTTRELADRLQVHPRTLLRKAKKGEGPQPIRLGARGRAALRWPAEAGR